LSHFYRQLATLLDAGVQPGRALQILIDQRSGPARKVALKMQAAVREGHSFAECCRQSPGVFPPLHVLLIEAGELSGRLDVMLVRLADTLDQAARLRGELVTRLLYPALVLHVAVGVQAIVKLFLESGMAALRQAALGFGLIYGCALAIWLAWKLIQRVPALHLFVSAVAYYTPVLHGVLHSIGTARFARTCEALYHAGIPMPKTIQTAAEASGNIVLQRQILRAVPIVREGGNAAEALSSTGAFSPTVASMLHTGSESGRLDAMLLRIADQAELQANTSLERLGKVIPVILYLFVAAWVAYLIYDLFVRDYLKTINDLLNG